MQHPLLDIIVPVWNRPVETRACLVSLINSSSTGTRLIMVNNGSERETENLLDEFAEGLDGRGVVIGSARNHGFVKALNMGLERVESEFAGVVRVGSTVTKEWHDPLISFLHQRPEAGITVPSIGSRDGMKSDKTPPRIIEVSHGHFSAMLIRTEMFRRIGGFDEGMDGGEWCLKDFSRRACREGYLTYLVGTSRVVRTPEREFGSELRREETKKRSRQLYEERWGSERSYFLYFPPHTTIETVEEKLETVLAGARRGNRFALLLSHSLHRELQRGNRLDLHENIVFLKLPRLFAERHSTKIAAEFASNGAVLVRTGTESGFPGELPAITLHEMERMLAIHGEPAGCRRFSNGDPGEE